MGGHAYLSAVSPLHGRLGQKYGIRSKLRSFKGGNKSPHSIFAATLTKGPTARELHRGEPKVLNVHSKRNLNSTAPFSYYRGNVFSGLTTLLP